MKQQTKQSGKESIYMTEFTSIKDQLKFNEENEQNTQAFRPSIPDSQDDSSGAKNFTMTKNYNEAQELITNGWNYGSKELTKQLKVSNKNIGTKDVRKTIYDVVGFQVSVPRYLQGIPTNMINQKRIKQKEKIVNLYKCITYPAKVSAQKILEDSVKFLQIIQAVEKKGMRVNAYTVFASENGSETLFYTTKIKSSNERLNISKMSFPLMHPSFLRRIIFKTMESDQRLTTVWDKGYGKPANTKKTENLLSDLNKNGIVIPTLISDDEAHSLVENVKK